MSTQSSLIRELVTRDLKLRYGRPRLGFAWLVLSPLLLVGVFYVVFYKFLHVRSEDAPFLLYLMSAVFPWMFFQNSLTCAITSLFDSKNLIKESDFPHYLIPLSVALANFIQFAPSLFILLITSAVLLKGLPVLVVALPLVLCMHFMLTVGLSVICSLIYLRARDIKYIIEVFLVFLFYLTPVFYPLSLVRSSLPPALFKLYTYNPFVGLISLYRIATLKDAYHAIRMYLSIEALVYMPILFSILIFSVSIIYYRHVKHGINDHLSY